MNGFGYCREAETVKRTYIYYLHIYSHMIADVCLGIKFVIT